MKVESIMTYVIVVVLIILFLFLLYDYKMRNDLVYINPEKDIARFVLMKEGTQLYPYLLTLKKSAEVNGVPLYEIKFENKSNLYLESIVISFVFLNEDEDVIGVEVREFIDIPSKMYIEELVTLNNYQPFHTCRWFVIGVLTQK